MTDQSSGRLKPLRTNRIKGSTADRIFSAVNGTILFVLVILTAYPVYYVLIASLSDPLAILQGRVWLLPVDFNINAYRRVLMNDEIMIGYRNSIIYTVLGTSVNLVMTTLAAYPLSRKNLKGRAAITLFIIFTMFFSGGMVPTFIIYQGLGLYDNLWVMILPGAIGVTNMIIMRTYFQYSIPEELYDAAYMDGASNMQTLMRIVIPLSLPIYAVMMMYYGIGHWNKYFTPMIYMRDRAKFPLQLIMREILIKDEMSEMLESTDTVVDQILLSEGLKYAVIIAASLPVLVLYPFMQKYFAKGVMIGAVKG